MNPSDREQLEVALAAPRPIATDCAELEIERLVPADQRRAISEIDEFLSELRSIKPEGQVRP